MREIHEEFRYDHPVNEVFALIASGAFQVELTEHLGGKNVKLLDDAGADGSVTLTVSQQTAVDLPGFAKKLVPTNATVTQTYEWPAAEADGSHRGRWSAVTKGAPISIGGPTELLPSDQGGTVHRFLGQIKANVPLVGGKLESFAHDSLTRDLARSHVFITDRLRG